MNKSNLYMNIGKGMDRTVENTAMKGGFWNEFEI